MPLFSYICLIIASFNETFADASKHADASKYVDKSRTFDKDSSVGEMLMSFVKDYMDKFFECLGQRMALEKNLDETAILVRALDRFHRRLQVHTAIPIAGTISCFKHVVEGLREVGPIFSILNKTGLQ